MLIAGISHSLCLSHTHYMHARMYILCVCLHCFFTHIYQSDVRLGLNLNFFNCMNCHICEILLACNMFEASFLKGNVSKVASAPSTEVTYLLPYNHLASPFTFE